MGKKYIKILWPKSKYSDIKFNSNMYEELWGMQHKHLSISSAIPILFSLTPRNFKIAFQDENINEINFDEKIDLVAIGGLTGLADRAYEIADEFKKRGVPVIMGGIHVSSLPEEALQHADSVVIGEVEGLWEQILADFLQNKLKKIYKSEEFYDLENYKPVNYRMIDLNNYMTKTLQTTRGCPYNCEFCSVSGYYGNKIRCKTVKSSIKELVNLFSNVPFFKESLMLSDDHFNGPRQHAMEFLKELEKIQSKIDKLQRSPFYFLKCFLVAMGIKFKIPLHTPMYVVQARVDIYKDDEMLDLLAKTGCFAIIIGFESISQASLNGFNKKNNAEEYKAAIDKIQSKGIAVNGSFIVGNDLEDISVFKETAKFIMESKMLLPVVSIVTPYPGTKLYDRLKEEGRLLDKEYCYWDSNHVCFTPKNMTVQELQDGYYWMNQKIFDYNARMKCIKEVLLNWTKNGIRCYDPSIRLFIIQKNQELSWFAFSMPMIPDDKYI
jgi:radical SAM superfamily enzyme YgiQ (UPF0313 family)